MTNRRSLIINTLLDHLRAISTDPSVYTANAIANVTDGRVDTLIFDNRGRFYDEGISRTLIDFEALRAEATATVENGSVTAITLTEPGKAYDFVPNVTIDAPDSESVTALASASRSDNAISAISVNNSGTFYLTPPSVTVSDPPGYSSEYARFDSSSYYIHGETVDYLRISTGDVLISQGGLATLFTERRENRIVSTNASHDTGSLIFYLLTPGEALVDTVTLLDNDNIFIDYDSVERNVHLRSYSGNVQLNSVALEPFRWYSFQVVSDGTSLSGYANVTSNTLSGAHRISGDYTIRNLSNAQIYIDELAVTQSEVVVSDVRTSNLSTLDSLTLYENFEPPRAIACAQVESGVVSAITVLDGGADYTGVATVTVEAPTGVPADFRASAQATVVEGSVSSISVEDGGLFYTSSPSVQIQSPSSLSGIQIRVKAVNGSIYFDEVVSEPDTPISESPEIVIQAPAISFNSTVHPSNVFRQFKFLDEINDFPTITLIPGSEQFEYYGGGNQLRSLRFSVRGYVYDGDDTLEVSENLADDIETVVEHLPRLAPTACINRAQVLSVRTDEGLMTPYGVCDLELEILYDGEL